METIHMKAGFIGLGALGKTIAQRLISQGVELIVWNRTASKAEGLGAKVAADPAELAAGVDTIFICLFDSAGVASVLGQMGGDALRGKLVIDLTTNHFATVLDFHRQVAEMGGSYLESPVLGSVVPASKGALTVVTSGEKQAHDRTMPLLEKIAANIFYLEAPGAATRMKLINNLCLGTFMATIAEALSTGEAAGIDKGKVLEILAAGAGNSGVLNAKREKLLSGDFSVHFSNALIHKDLHFLQDLCRQLNRPLFMGSMAKEVFGIAMANGMGKEDFSSVYRVFK
jgi:3-hydroxyisobutyrate dehydrogenase